MSGTEPGRSREVWCNVFIAPAGWQYLGVIKATRAAADRSARDPDLGRRIGIWRVKLKGGRPMTREAAARTADCAPIGPATDDTNWCHRCEEWVAGKACEHSTGVTVDPATVRVFVNPDFPEDRGRRREVGGNDLTREADREAVETALDLLADWVQSDEDTSPDVEQRYQQTITAARAALARLAAGEGEVGLTDAIAEQAVSHTPANSEGCQSDTPDEQQVTPEMVEAAARSLCYTSHARCSSMDAEAWADPAYRSRVMDAAEDALCAALAAGQPARELPGEGA